MSSVCIRLGFFMKITHVCVAQKAYELFTKLSIKPDFLSLADKIAEPRPDMNIKVAAFTVSKKSINTGCYCNLDPVFKKLSRLNVGPYLEE